MKTIQVALIGAGGIGSAHSNAYEQIPDAHVCAVVDIRKDNAAKLAGIHGAKAYTSVNEMFASEKPEMSDICTPSFTHPEIAMQSIQHGLHVLVEKPIAYTLDDARLMIDTAKKKQKMLMVAQVVRFWPEYVYIKQIYEAGTYGKLVQAWFSRVCGAPLWAWDNWYVDASRSGLAPFELHIHDTDFIHFMFGKPDSVRSQAVNIPDMYASYLKTRYQYKNLPGVIIEAEAGWWKGPLPFSATFRVVFEKAVLVYDSDKLTVYPADANEGKTVDLSSEVQMTSAINLKNTSGIYNEIAYFVNCIKTGIGPTVITPEQSYTSLKLLLAEIESSRIGAELDV